MADTSSTDIATTVSNDVAQAAQSLANSAVNEYNTVAMNTAAAGQTAAGTAGNPVVTISANPQQPAGISGQTLIIGALIYYFLFRR